MAKKKAARASTRQARTARKKVGKKTMTAGKRRAKAVKKVAAKKVAKLAKVKRAVKAPKKIVARKPKAAPRPKPPKPTKPALPPQPTTAPPAVVDVEAVPAPPAPEAGQPSPPAAQAEEAEPAPSTGADRAATAGVRPTQGPQVGELAPDFELLDETGQRHRLSAYRGQKVVLYFYPKDDTPGCTTEACGFRDRLASFTDRNAVVLGVSPDSVASHRRFSQKYGLTFPLLADEDHAVAARYGVWVEKETGGKMTAGIARTTFLIGPDGRITHVFRNVRPEGHERQVLEHLGF